MNSPNIYEFKAIPDIPRWETPMYVRVLRHACSTVYDNTYTRVSTYMYHSLNLPPLTHPFPPPPQTRPFLYTVELTLVFVHLITATACSVTLSLID